LNISLQIANRIPVVIIDEDIPGSCRIAGRKVGYLFTMSRSQFSRKNFAGSCARGAR
jgi:hypothetical protein